MTVTRPQDDAFLVLPSLLIGLIFAVTRHGAALGRRPAVNGFATYLAVGGPICDKVVVALLGVGAAMTWFAPIQPLTALGALAVVRRVAFERPAAWRRFLPHSCALREPRRRPLRPVRDLDPVRTLGTTTWCRTYSGTTTAATLWP